MPARWLEVSNGTKQRTGICPNQGVPTRLHRFHPFGLAAKRDAGNAEEVGLLLHAPTVREDFLRIHQGREEVQVAEGIHDPKISWKTLTVGLMPDTSAGPRMNWEEDWPVESAHCWENPRQNLPIVYIPRSVQRQEKISPTIQAQAPREVPLMSCPTPMPGRVVHHIAHAMDAPPDSFDAQVPNRGRGWTEEEIREMVDRDTIHLLRHGTIEDAKPSFDMTERDSELGGRERGSEGGVGVPEHESAVGPLFLKQRAKALHDLRGLLRVARRSHAEDELRLSQAYGANDQFAHVPIVVLAGVNEQRNVPPRDRPQERLRLDEFRPRPGDNRDLHSGPIVARRYGSFRTVLSWPHGGSIGWFLRASGTALVNPRETSARARGARPGPPHSSEANSSRRHTRGISGAPLGRTGRSAEAHRSAWQSGPGRRGRRVGQSRWEPTMGRSSPSGPPSSQSREVRAP